jgi:methylmalonyl-CoA mutase
MRYEQRKHDGTLPIVGVNTFLADPATRTDQSGRGDGEPARPLELARGTEEEKQSQLARLADFHQRHQRDAEAALDRLRAAAMTDENVFAVLLEASRVCSLGQITDTFFEVGGAYRRNI